MIEEFTAGMDFEAFRANPMAVAAVEKRNLLTIGEALSVLAARLFLLFRKFHGGRCVI